MSRKGRQRHTDLQHLTDDDIQYGARDPQRTKAERKRFQHEEKCRGLRNKQKRSGRSP